MAVPPGSLTIKSINSVFQSRHPHRGTTRLPHLMARYRVLDISFEVSLPKMSPFILNRCGGPDCQRTSIPFPSLIMTEHAFPLKYTTVF